MMAQPSKENTKHIEVFVNKAIDEEKLYELFAEMVNDQFFHPHDFSKETAKMLSSYGGKDFYIMATYDGLPAAYCCLRGFDDGYEVPSLGIYVSASMRGKGLGRHMMNFCHRFLRLHRIKKVMLKSYKDNHRANSLYESLGYKLEDLNEKMYIAYLDL